MDDFKLTLEFSPEHSLRKCGDCQACCRLLPVRSLDKAAGVRCKHQRFQKGCKVYERLEAISPECRTWSCQWLNGTVGYGMGRPDHTHYVIDIMPDFVFVKEANEHIPVVQVWCDPAHPDAHRDPALRAWLLHKAMEDGMMAVIRYDSKRGFVLIPPIFNSAREWVEHESQGAEQFSTWPGVSA